MAPHDARGSLSFYLVESEECSMWKTSIGLRGGWGTAVLALSVACTGVASLPGGGSGGTGTVGGGGGGGTGGNGAPGNGTAGNGTPGTPGNNGAPTTASTGNSTNPPPGTQAVGSLINAVATTTMDSGRVQLRRLNQTEYNNTVGSLLGTQLTPASAFPGDDVNDGFDDLGSALTYSELLMEDQDDAALALVTELMARPATDPLYTAIITCTPTTANLQTCLTQILTGFMASAYRRPVTAAEVAPFATLGVTNAATTSVTQGVTDALRAVLDSANFLYHVEVGNPQYNPMSVSSVTLTDYETANRLSYFLWQNMPDATLTALAAKGGLAGNSTAIMAQADRMIQDPKAQNFVNNFGGQWIGVRNVPLVSPDATVFPNVTQDFIDAIAPETIAFFNYQIANNRPITELVTANYSFVNGTLAAFYGLTSVPATQTTFTQASLTDATGMPRSGGILTQETFLTTTSMTDRTSPVKRGEYILTTVLCSPPQQPPPGVPLLNAPAAGSNMSVRQALDAHAANPSCAACHNTIDPIGYAFESFDAIGEFRTTDNGVPIDPSGKFPEPDNAAQPSFTNADTLSQIVASDWRYAACVVKQAMTFGIGRSFDQPDAMDYVTGLAQPLQGKATWTDVLHTVVSSQAFQTTRGESM
jgi:hypothetical protein